MRRPKLDSHAARQRGSALISALWVSLALGVLIAAMGYSARQDSALARNARDMAQLASAMKGAAQLAHADLEVIRRQITAASPTIQRHYTIGDMRIEVVFTDEAGRIDVNTAPADLLTFLFETAGADTVLARVLTDQLQDWRDPNTIRRLNGAEKTGYRLADLDYGPADAPLLSASELKLLLNMTPDIYERLLRMVTLNSLQRGFDPTLAPDILQKASRQETQSDGTTIPNPTLRRFTSRSRQRVYRLDLHGASGQIMLDQSYIADIARDTLSPLW